jgi:hypothetical protein
MTMFDKFHDLQLSPELNKRFDCPFNIYEIKFIEFNEWWIHNYHQILMLNKFYLFNLLDENIQ